MLKPLDAESIKKSLFGIVPDLSALFSEFAFVGMSHEYRQNTPQSRREIHRTYHNFPQRFFYLAARNCPTIDQTFATFVSKGFALCAEPLAAVRKAAENRCCEGRLASFEIIPWPHTGHALVLAHDAVMIANPWLAFVPLDALPTISMDNTRVIQGVK
jgi:hypothetical protein